MTGLVRLLAPAGTDELNVGTVRYLRHADGGFWVPSDVAASVCDGRSGFYPSPLDDTRTARAALVEIGVLARGLPEGPQKAMILSALTDSDV